MIIPANPLFVRCHLLLRLLRRLVLWRRYDPDAEVRRAIVEWTRSHGEEDRAPRSLYLVSTSRPPQEGQQ
jgi:hypothetical protein